MKKVLFLILLILVLVFVGCNKGNNNNNGENNDTQEIKIEYNSEIYVGQTIEIKIVQGTNDIIFLETDSKVIEIVDYYHIKAKKVGTAEATIYFDNGKEKTITINVLPKEKQSIKFSLLENPEEIKFGITYHYDVTVTGKGDTEWDMIVYSTGVEIDREEKTIRFTESGRKNLDVFLVSDRATHDDVFFDVHPNEDVEYYSIMYIGNSFTYYMDIPSMVKQMILEHCDYVMIKSDLVGGQYLHDALKKYTNDFDGEYFTHVILQDQSSNAATNFSDFRNSVLEYSNLIDRTKTEIILYQTWVDYIGSETTTPNKTKQQAIIDGYNSVGSEINARVIRVGEAFWKASENEAIPYLYIDDNHHQNIFGAYLSACMHYRMLTGRPASELKYIPSSLGFTEEIASTLRSIADSFFDN